MHGTNQNQVEVRYIFLRSNGQDANIKPYIARYATSRTQNLNYLNKYDHVLCLLSSYVNVKEINCLNTGNCF